MKLVVGLGNPESNFLRTRHNIGYMAIDEMLARNKTSEEVVLDNKNRAYLTKDFAYLKPADGMNSSGLAVKKAVDALSLNIKSDIVILYDDMDFDLGKYKISQTGSYGKHNGVKSVYAEVSPYVIRVRLGIGRPKNIIMINHVLSPFENHELETLGKVISRAAEIVEYIKDHDIANVMSKYNGKGEL